MQTINDLRKELKPLGFTVAIESQSYGKHAIYRHIATKEQLTFNVFTPDRLAVWGPLIEWREKNKDRLKLVSMYSGKIYGLI